MTIDNIKFKPHYLKTLTYITIIIKFIGDLKMILDVKATNKNNGEVISFALERRRRIHIRRNPHARSS